MQATNVPEMSAGDCCAAFYGADLFGRLLGSSKHPHSQEPYGVGTDLLTRLVLVLCFFFWDNYL
jgi:hypothetical protein